ncbi:unnamed protein product [Linum trigynum]|uniref:Uncharacterized protein n=1 Tax=Linum trigynum TaxID=586398 RepID=A0AAV2DA78_9ROSI
MEERLPSPHLPLSPPVSRCRHYLPHLCFSLSLKNPQKTSNQVWNRLCMSGSSSPLSSWCLHEGEDGGAMADLMADG